MELTAVAVDLAPHPGDPTPTPLRWSPASATPVRQGTVACGPLEVEVACSPLGTGQRVDLVVCNPRRPGARRVALDRVRLLTSARPTTALEHGWQSWSPVGRRRVTDVVPLRRLAPWWVRATYHAAPELAGRAVTGDQFLLMADGCGEKGASGGLVGFLDGARHLSTVVATPAAVLVVALLDGVALAPGESRALDPLWLAVGDPGRSYSEYLAHWSAAAGARAGAGSPLGWCSWYQYFAKVTPEACRRNLALAADHGFELFQLDDGYQRAVGDWLQPNERFEADPPSRLAAEIAGRGLTAGIWTAPFLASPRSDVARSHPGWIAGARRTGARGPSRGRPCRAMWNPLAWGGWAMALDTTDPSVLDHLRRTFASLAGQGWRYHKIDFCYAAAVPARRRGDGASTRAEAIRAGLQAVRDGAGPDAVILGCGIPLAQSVGLVDVMRVSADTAPRWSPGPLRPPGYSDLAPAAVSALQASVLRAPMHRRLWVNDPDCLLLRPVRTRLTSGQRRLLTEAAAGTGAFTVVSDDLDTYGPDEWAALDRLRRSHERADAPLDLVDPFADELVVGGAGGRRLEVRWRGRWRGGLPPYARFDEGAPAGAGELPTI